MTALSERGRMADVINLRTARKARARVAKAGVAAANRAAFGRTRAERTADAAAAARRQALLDGAKREVVAGASIPDDHYM